MTDIAYSPPRGRRPKEIGAVGLPLFAGYLSLDPNKYLRGQSAVRIYREMKKDEPAATAITQAAYQLLRTDVGVEPGGKRRTDKEAAAHLESALLGMRDSLATTMRQAYSFLWAGWCIQELVYKRDGRGRVAWDAWALRRQETLYRWLLDAKRQRIATFSQRPPPSYTLRQIPLAKCNHFVADDSEGSPEGESIYRGMYRQWFFVKNFELLLGIGLERGVGLPVFQFEPGAPAISPEDKTRLETIAGNMRQNEEAFLLLPPGISFKFAPLPGVSAGEYLTTIDRMRVWMLATGLADFIALGTGGRGGAYALGKDKSELFLLALNGFQDRLLTTLNRHAVVRLCNLNGWYTGEDAPPGALGQRLTAYPRLTLPAVRRYDLASLGQFASTLHKMNALHITPEDEAWFRKISDLVDLDGRVLRALHAADGQAAGPGDPEAEREQAEEEARAGEEGARRPMDGDDEADDEAEDDDEGAERDDDDTDDEL